MSPSPTLPPGPKPIRTLPPAAGPPRRALLTGTVGTLGALGLTAGCSGAGDTKNPEQTAAAHQLRATAAQHSRSLLARYDATLAAHGTLAPRLAPLRAAVAQHVETFGGGRHRRDGDAHREVPGEAPQALSALAGAERRTADAHTSALLQAPPELARTLASAAAAGAAHGYLLGQSDSGQGGGDEPAGGAG